MMKKISILFFVAFIGISNLMHGQIPPCLWAQNGAGSDDDQGQSIATDASGNVIVTGHFKSPTIIFGTTTLTNSSAGSNEIFIVKYSPSGAVLWATSAVGPFDDMSAGISTDASGNIFVTGSFKSPTLTFGTITINGGDEFFIVKYSANGTVLWANAGGGAANDYGTGVSTDASGNIFVTGYFYSPIITFGAITLTNATSTSNENDMFIVKYSPTGAVLWANSAGGNSYDGARAVSADASGNVFVTGVFNSPTIAFGTTILSNAGTDDIFIVKYSPTGGILWAQSAGGTTSAGDIGTGICNDASGNVFVTGYSNSPALVFGTTTLTNVGSDDVFIAKYSPSGTVLWAKSAGGSKGDFGSGASTDASGNVYIVGGFVSPTITFGTTTLTNANGGTFDVFLVKYSPAGTVLWASSAGGFASDDGNGVSNDADGNVFIIGNFGSSNIAFGTTTLTNTGGTEVFIAEHRFDIVDINENQFEKSDINIYPNPFASQTTISFSEEQTNTSLQVIDLFGKEVISVCQFQGRQLVIDLGILKEGIYIVQVIDEKKNLTSRKIILQ